MPSARHIALFALLTGMTASAGAAQQRYFGVSAGATALEPPTGYRFRKGTAPVFTVFGGTEWRPTVAWEGRLSHLIAFRPPLVRPTPPPEGPIDERINAALMEANATWRPTVLKLRAIQAFASAGPAMAIRFEKVYSDTASERANDFELGLVGAIGLDLTLGRHFGLTARASYRHIGDGQASATSPLRVRGAGWEAGLRFAP